MSGNTCYMNSALQCLSNTEPLTEYFSQQTFKEHINKVSVTPLMWLFSSCLPSAIIFLLLPLHHSFSPSLPPFLPPLLASFSHPSPSCLPAYLPTCPPSTYLHSSQDNPLGMGGAIAEAYSELLGALWDGKHNICSPWHFKVILHFSLPHPPSHLHHHMPPSTHCVTGSCREICPSVLRPPATRLPRTPHIPVGWFA